MKPVEERYYVGMPCKFGHAGRRYKSTGACIECMRLKGIAKRQQRRELVAATRAA